MSFPNDGSAARAMRSPANAFSDTSYTVRKKVLTAFGKTFHIFNSRGDLVLFSKMKAFRIKADIRLYADEGMQSELLLMKARQALEFASGYYDVVDSASGEKVGVLRRKNVKSVLLDEWTIMDAADREIGVIREDNLALALFRRFVSPLLPQRYNGTVRGRKVCTFRQNFNPFVTKIRVDFSGDSGGAFDRRLGLAAAVLLCAIEGKQH